MHVCLCVCVCPPPRLFKTSHYRRLTLYLLLYIVLPYAYDHTIRAHGIVCVWYTPYPYGSCMSLSATAFLVFYIGCYGVCSIRIFINFVVVMC